MIAKSKRLTRKEVEAFFSKKIEEGNDNRKKHVLHTPSFFVMLLEAESFKAGVTVPKKLFKRAVDRNHLRRIIYDALKNQKFLSLPYHLLISVKKKSGEISRDLVESEVKELFKKIQK